MANISIVKAQSFANEPLNVDSISDAVFNHEEGVFRFTGYLGLLCEKAKLAGARIKLQIVAEELGTDGMLFRGRVTAGYGSEMIVSRFNTTSNLFFWMTALESEREGDLVDGAVHTVEILSGSSNTFVPTFQ